MSILMSIVMSLLPNVVKTFFGGISAKMGMIIAGTLIVVSLGSYMTYSYMNMKLQVTELQLTVQSFKAANEYLAEQTAHLQSTLDLAKQDYTEANTRRKVLEESFTETRTAMTEAQDVFDKECGRLERLMQTNASLVVRFANRATSKLSDEFTKASSNDN